MKITRRQFLGLTTGATVAAVVVAAPTTAPRRLAWTKFKLQKGAEVFDPRRLDAILSERDRQLVRAIHEAISRDAT